ncbi:MAG: hypothetical protein ACP5N2_06045 [Candidatus Nanoarchaeia archaeon]
MNKNYTAADIASLISGPLVFLNNERVEREAEITSIFYDVLVHEDVYDNFNSYLRKKNIKKRDIFFPAQSIEESINRKYMSLAFNDALVQVHLTIYKI